MAREFIAGGGGRHVWHALKQALAETLVAPCRRGGNVQRKIWSGGCSSGVSSSSSSARAETVGDSSSAWRDSLVEKASSSVGIPARRFDAGSTVLRGNYSEGLLTLLSRRPDAAVVLRSAAVLGKRSTQLSSLGKASDQWTLAASPCFRKLHSSLVGASFSSVVKREIGQSCCGPRLVSLTGTISRRSLSSGTWTERWNNVTQQLKNAVSRKPRATSEAARVGVKSGPVFRSREVLSDASSPLRKAFSHYREAVGLQIEAFWKRNYLVVVGIVGLGICLLLWRLMFGIASTFISLSEGLAKFGFLALAASMVIVGGVYLRARFTINPDAVYRVAMRRLNTSAAVLEVMGAPLSGSDLRAYIMSGGGFRLKNFRPRLAGKRCFIIFPIRGSERHGLVSIEVKKKKGQYNFKLLAVDVPTAGHDQRLYLVGDEDEYKVGGGLMSQLRDPIVKAMAAQKEFEELDLREEEDEDRKEMEAEIRAEEELDKVANEQADAEDVSDKSLEEQGKTQDELEKLSEPQGKDEKSLRAPA